MVHPERKKLVVKQVFKINFIIGQLVPQEDLEFVVMLNSFEKHRGRFYQILQHSLKFVCLFICYHQENEGRH
jgi:hypothetical protein